MTRSGLLTELASRIAAIHLDHPVRVAIDGVDAAGKTTLADDLVAPLRERGRSVIRASIDGFHRPAALRYRRGKESPDGYYHDSFDYEGLVGALLAPLGPGGSLRHRRAIFDHRRDAPVAVPFEDAGSDAVLLLDGVFLLRPELRVHWDFSVFLRVSFEVTTERARVRDAVLLGGEDKVRRRYARRYMPGQRLYLAETDPERVATVVVDNDDALRPEIVRID